jgi:hypothetical protein
MYDDDDDDDDDGAVSLHGAHSVRLTQVWQPYRDGWMDGWMD